MNLKNKNKNDNMKSVNQLNKRKFTKGKIEENNLDYLDNVDYDKPLVINRRKIELIKDEPQKKEKNHVDESDLGQDAELNKNKGKKEGICDKLCECCLIY